MKKIFVEFSCPNTHLSVGDKTKVNIEDLCWQFIFSVFIIPQEKELPNKKCG
jgi:hypothetical protein